MFKIVVLASLLILINLGLFGCAALLPQSASSNLPPQIKSFCVDPESVENGRSALLSWEVLNAESVEVEPGFKNAALSGSQQVEPAVTTDYTLSATNKFGISKSTLTLIVREPAAPAKLELPVILSFKAMPEQIWAGATVILSWEVLNATSLTLEGGDRKYDVKNGFGSKGLEVFIPTEYTLIAKNFSGFAESKTLVNIRKDEVYPVYGGESDSGDVIVVGGSGGGGTGGGG